MPKVDWNGPQEKKVQGLILDAFALKNQNMITDNLSYNTKIIGKWFEPRSISCLSCVIVRVRVVFKKTGGRGD